MTAKKPLRTMSGLVAAGKIETAKPPEQVSRLPSFSTAQPSSGLLSQTTSSPSPNVIHKLKLSELRPSPYNSRRIRPEDRIRDIAASLGIDGQREPLTVYRGDGEDAGYYLIVSGVTRYLAALSLRWDTLDARIDDSLKHEDVLAVLKASHLHNDSSPESDLDFSLVIDDLSQKGISIDAIALALGYNRREVYRLKKFQTLPNVLYDIASAHPRKFSGTVAEEFAKAVSEIGENVAVELANEFVTKDYGLPKLRSAIKCEKRKLERNRGVQTRAKKEINIPVSYGNSKVGHLSVLSIPNTTMKRIQLTADLPESVAEFFAERVETLTTELKGMAEGDES